MFNIIYFNLMFLYNLIRFQIELIFFCKKRRKGRCFMPRGAQTKHTGSEIKDEKKIVYLFLF